jgi:hypothetical protein
MPAVLEALRRQQLFEQANQSVESAGIPIDEEMLRRRAASFGAPDPFPIGQEFVSNPNLPNFTHDVPSGALGAISAAIAGLGPSMGSQAPMQPDPRTLTMRSMPSVDTNKSILRSNMTGIDPLVSEVTRNPNNSKQLAAGGSTIGVTNESAFNKNRDAFHAGEQAKTDLLAQRGIARGDAANLRATGLDPRTAALLTAIKGMTGDTGDMANAFVTGGALGGPAAGMGFVNEQGQRQNNRATTEAFREANAGKATASGAPAINDPNKPQTEATKPGVAAPPNPVIQAERAAADAVNPPANDVDKARRDEVTQIMTNFNGKVTKRKAQEFASHYLQKKYGLSPQEAAATVTNATGEAYGGTGIDPENDPELHPFSSDKSVEGGAADMTAKWIYDMFGPDAFNWIGR